MPAVSALAEHLDAAVLTTFNAKGQISDRHPLGCGVLGRSGTPVASWMMNESDLLLVFGASFSDRTGIAPHKTIVQVDFDPMSPWPLPSRQRAGLGARRVDGTCPSGRDDKKPKIVAVTGDGGFEQYMAELTTAVKYAMPITHVLLNNQQLGKIAKEQRAADMAVWQVSLRNPSFAAYAELCGAKGLTVERRDQLDDALTKAIDHAGPSLVEVRSDADLG